MVGAPGLAPGSPNAVQGGGSGVLPGPGGAGGSGGGGGGSAFPPAVSHASLSSLTLAEALEASKRLEAAAGMQACSRFLSAWVALSDWAARGEPPAGSVGYVSLAGVWSVCEANPRAALRVDVGASKTVVDFLEDPAFLNLVIWEAQQGGGPRRRRRWRRGRSRRG